MVKSNESKKFAVIKISGVQLKVYEGKEYEVNKLEGKKGETLEIQEVLLLHDGENTKVGTPLVEGAKVVLEITSQKKDDKVRVFKYKAKSRYRKTQGHRALITRVSVKSIA
ncbi:50S ribosomal protein L21 [Candidatus Dojkabacteria bacterium HGW-Dojkabacteria-1]|uniref:Large ribosomal subunit protein bL21 n=1 Tax=Candidatus Dojkabacteria bacterium HGW-Dojkabacteria-1 TaxID=2013761 RepID=A0A2N2F3N5_9BACT|nr:MAG: 50S ribosomal protein L21 [Candidatus Dojkabacteria bacterium HGW-Dojkabacteria-1]